MRLRLHHLDCTQDLALPPEQAWDFFSSPQNLQDITPDDLGRVAIRVNLRGLLLG